MELLTARSRDRAHLKDDWRNSSPTNDHDRHDGSDTRSRLANGYVTSGAWQLFRTILPEHWLEPSPSLAHIFARARKVSVHKLTKAMPADASVFVGPTKPYRFSAT